LKNEIKPITNKTKITVKNIFQINKKIILFAVSKETGEAFPNRAYISTWRLGT